MRLVIYSVCDDVGSLFDVAVGYNANIGEVVDVRYATSLGDGWDLDDFADLPVM